MPCRDSPHYVTVTSALRKESDQLFVAIIKPHKSVVACTIARWLKEVLNFQVLILVCSQPIQQGATTAADSGVTTSDILKAAGWSTESVFKKFYNHPTHDPFFGWAVLSSVTKDTSIMLHVGV